MSVISGFVIAVCDVETGERREVDVQCAAGIVDVLAIRRQLGVPGTHRVSILQQRLELVVVGERDLVQYVRGHWVEKVLHNDPKQWALGCHCHSCILPRRLPRPGFQT